MLFNLTMSKFFQKKKKKIYNKRTGCQSADMVQDKKRSVRPSLLYSYQLFMTPDRAGTAKRIVGNNKKDLLSLFFTVLLDSNRHDAKLQVYINALAFPYKHLKLVFISIKR